MDRENRVYLIRHGQIDGYEGIPVIGHTDVDLTETGSIQMHRMAERLRFADIKAIYSSDLKRSVTGARIIAQYHDVPLYTLPGLREMYFGKWEGLNMSEVQERFPDELKTRQADLAHYRAPGGGESPVDLSNRVLDCFKDILPEHRKDDIAIVAHGGVNRIILCDALGLEISRMFHIQQDYGCLNIVDYFPNFTLVRLING